MIGRPRDFLNLIVSSLVLAVVLVLPWPVGRMGTGQTFAGAVAATTRELHVAAYGAVSRFADFHANLETAGSGELVLPERVQGMLSLLRGEWRGVKSYGVSDGISASDWDLQQLVASAWPRRLDPQAHVRFQLASEALPPGFTVIGRRKEVLLVYRP